MKTDSCVIVKRICTGAAHRALFASPEVTLEKSPRDVQVHLLSALAAVVVLNQGRIKITSCSCPLTTPMGRQHDVS